MTTTVAAIAARAFTGVNAKISGVIKSVSVTRIVTQGEYDPITGTYGEPVTSTDSGRAIFDTQRPVETVFPGYVAGEGEKLVWLEGLSAGAAVNEVFEIGGVDHILTKVGDIVGAGSFFAAMCVKSE